MSAEGLIRRAREHRGQDQASLARAAGVTANSVSAAELAANPSARLLARYGAAMGYELIIAYRDTDGTIID